MESPNPSRQALRIQRRKRRRVVFTGVLGLAVVVAVAVVILLPHNKSSNNPPSTKSTSSAGGTATTSGGHDTTDGTSKGTTTTTDPNGTLGPIATPTASDPLRVLEIGDSLGEDLGFQMQNDLTATGLATLAMDSQGDTGLANEGYYDWPTELESDLSSSRPEIVVIFLGANDGQGFDVNGEPVDFGTNAWITAYTSRVDQMITESLTAGARVLWVGMPPMENSSLNAEIQQIDSIFENQVAKYGGAFYMSSAPVLAPGGQFTSTLTSSTGETETIRTPDGVHLTSPGAELLSQSVIKTIDSHWHLNLKP